MLVRIAPSVSSPPPAPPKQKDYHLFETELGSHVLAADGSRVYSIGADTARALAADPDEFGRLGLQPDARYVDDTAVEDPPLRALSLAVAQKCNLGCVYCYASRGTFGDAPQNMSLEVALAAVDRLFEGASAGTRLNLSFLGGEPLVNRGVLRAAVEHATRRAAETGVVAGYSITTNGTLISGDDGQFFESHGFAVTISMDGAGADHDRLRPFQDGRGSYSRILERVTPLLAMQRRMQVSARVTVTPSNLDLRGTLETLLGLGFHSVGFSPMLASPGGAAEMGSGDLSLMLERMIECGQSFERSIVAGERFAFSNMATAMREIHRGTHRPYPCGAGAGYLGVSATGELAACHRFVGDAAGAMGNLRDGVDSVRQNAWLRERHVHLQEPCSGCWARYLCGGGCHHEVIHRGRPACDYIRGWLHYCLQAYVRLLDRRPDYFD